MRSSESSDGPRAVRSSAPGHPAHPATCGNTSKINLSRKIRLVDGNGEVGSGGSLARPDSWEGIRRMVTVSTERPERAGGPTELGQVGDSRIVQVQWAGVAQLHDGGPREGLGDRGPTEWIAATAARRPRRRNRSRLTRRGRPPGQRPPPPFWRQDLPRFPTVCPAHYRNGRITAGSLADVTGCNLGHRHTATG